MVSASITNLIYFSPSLLLSNPPHLRKVCQLRADDSTYRRAGSRVLHPYPPVRGRFRKCPIDLHRSANFELFRHAIAVIFCFGALGGICTAFIATLGPKTGMRTMIITRYSSGYVGGMIYSVLNIITQCVFIL